MKFIVTSAVVTKLLDFISIFLGFYSQLALPWNEFDYSFLILDLWFMILHRVSSRMGSINFNVFIMILETDFDRNILKNCLNVTGMRILALFSTAIQTHPISAEPLWQIQTIPTRPDQAEPNSSFSKSGSEFVWRQGSVRNVNSGKYCIMMNFCVWVRRPLYLS